MGTSTHHQSNEFATALLSCIVLLCCAMQLSGQVSASSRERDTPEGGEDWLRYKVDAQRNLKKASECVEAGSPERACRDFLDAAASDYRAMVVMLGDSSQNIEAVVQLADGLRRAGRLGDGIDLLRRYESREDGNLLHLLGDMLYGVGDYHNAAIAYRKWIGARCTGYLLSLDDHGLWARPIKGDPCTSLPAELRARLEDLQQITHGEPSNLPQQARTAMRITSR
jgi:hypothetical protein